MTLIANPVAKPALPAPTRAAAGWRTVCRYRDLVPERGAVALLEGHQIALVRTHDGAVHAVSNVDPFSGAPVLARGIVGDRAGEPTVTSPMYKQAFALATGRCLDDESVRLTVYPVRVQRSNVQVALPVDPADPDGRG